MNACQKVFFSWTSQWNPLSLRAMVPGRAISQTWFCFLTPFALDVFSRGVLSLLILVLRAHQKQSSALGRPRPCSQRCQRLNSRRFRRLCSCLIATAGAHASCSRLRSSHVTCLGRSECSGDWGRMSPVVFFPALSLHCVQAEFVFLLWERNHEAEVREPFSCHTGEVFGEHGAVIWHSHRTVERMA